MSKIKTLHITMRCSECGRPTDDDPEMILDNRGRITCYACADAEQYTDNSTDYTDDDDYDNEEEDPDVMWLEDPFDPYGNEEDDE